MFLKTESYKKGIVLSTTFNFISKGLVFLNSLLIAFYFGAQIKTDIYFYSYNTIIILSAFITSLNSSVLIPESMRLRNQHSESQAMKFLNFFFYCYLVLVFLICVILYCDPIKGFRLVSDFNIKSLAQNEKILYLSIPLILLIPLVNLLTDILTSYKYFSIPMIAGIINGFFSLCFLIIFHNTLDVSALLIGLIISNSLNLFLLIILMLKKLNWNFKMSFEKVEIRIWKNILFAQAGNITSSLSNYLPLYILSGFNFGVITSLNYAQQISTLPTTLITNQFSAVCGIKFNEQYAKKNYQELNKTFVVTANFLLFILVPVSATFFLFSNDIVTLLLKHGAFNRNNVEMTASFLKYLGLLLPLMVINTLFSRLFMASHKIIQSFWYQIVFNVILISTLFIVIKKVGPVGYPITLVSVHVLNILVCYFLEKWYFNIINYSLVLKNFLLITLINGSVCFLFFIIKSSWVFPTLLTLLMEIPLYFLIVAGLGFQFEINNTFNSFISKSWSKILYYARSKS